MSATSKFQKRLMEGKPMFNYSQTTIDLMLNRPQHDHHVLTYRLYMMYSAAGMGNAWYPNYERYK